METLNTCTNFLTEVMNNRSSILLSNSFQLFIQKLSSLAKISNSEIIVKVKPKGHKCLHCGKYILQANTHKAIGLWCNPTEHFMCSTECLRRHSLVCTNFNLLELNYITCPFCRVPISPDQISEAFDGKIDQFRSDAIDRALLSLLNEEGKKELEAKFTCNICYTDYKVSEGITLECDHRFCEPCMKNYTIGQVEAAQVSDSSLICPLCKHPMTLYEIEDIVGPELFEKYQKFLLRGFKISEEEDPNSSIFQCPGKDCEFFCIVDKNLNSIECPKCFIVVCPKCKEKEHPDMTCDEFKATFNNNAADKVFDELLAREGIIKCPSCGAAVQRIDGCEFMVCTSSACQGRTYFCFDCGKKLPADHAPHPCDKRLRNIRPAPMHIPGLIPRRGGRPPRNRRVNGFMNLFGRRGRGK